MSPVAPSISTTSQANPPLDEKKQKQSVDYKNTLHGQLDLSCQESIQKKITDRRVLIANQPAINGVSAITNLQTLFALVLNTPRLFSTAYNALIGFGFQSPKAMENLARSGGLVGKACQLMGANSRYIEETITSIHQSTTKTEPSDQPRTLNNQAEGAVSIDSGSLKRPLTDSAGTEETPREKIAKTTPSSDGKEMPENYAFMKSGRDVTNSSDLHMPDTIDYDKITKMKKIMQSTLSSNNAGKISPEDVVNYLKESIHSNNPSASLDIEYNEELGRGMICQTDRVTISGQALAVKTVSPELLNLLSQDMMILRNIISPLVNMKYGSDNLQCTFFDSAIKQIIEEANLSIELANSEIIYDFFENYKPENNVIEVSSGKKTRKIPVHFSAPKTYQHYSNNKVLVMDLMPGCPLDRSHQVFSILENWKPEWNNHQELNTEQINQILQDLKQRIPSMWLSASKNIGFSNIDLHPGNCMFWTDDNSIHIGFIDNGSCREMFPMDEKVTIALNNNMMLSLSAFLAIKAKEDNFQKLSLKEVENLTFTPISETTCEAVLHDIIDWQRYEKQNMALEPIKQWYQQSRTVKEVLNHLYKDFKENWEHNDVWAKIHDQPNPETVVSASLVSILQNSHSKHENHGTKPIASASLKSSSRKIEFKKVQITDDELRELLKNPESSKSETKSIFSMNIQQSLKSMGIVSSKPIIFIDRLKYQADAFKKFELWDKDFQSSSGTPV
ncbi:AarF/UbiB family protein [Endozoicomonas ascidiicola]|uniref:AarF/UbiB family protein n=1 Tax=Endozoicomonas ascidiicola TaxID=1698521 RepID=UPI0008311A6E|nr:AarF/UbiB family protein [Endozoicomonas ascidiicola]